MYAPNRDVAAVPIGFFTIKKDLVHGQGKKKELGMVTKARVVIADFIRAVQTDSRQGPDPSGIMKTGGA